MENSRAMILYTFLVLKKYSNEDNPLNANQIANHIKKEFLLTKEPNRKTIYSHLDELEKLSENKIANFEILAIDDHGRQTGHYMVSDFTKPEIRLLCDAIASSNFISQTYSDDLITKLGDLYGDNLTSKYINILKLKSAKSTNQDLFRSIEELSAAIESNQKITFKYFTYNLKKELVPKKTGSDQGEYRTVSPYYLIWAINHYYLMCKYENDENFRFLRVDKMKDVKSKDEKSEPLPKNFDVHKYAKNQAFMFGGDAENISLRCEMRMLDQVIDFFGEEAQLIPIDDNYFRVKIKTSIESIKYWVLQYITAIDEIEPKKLRDIIIEFLEDGLRRNKGKYGQDQDEIAENSFPKNRIGNA